MASQPNVISAALAADAERGKHVTIAPAVDDNVSNSPESPADTATTVEDTATTVESPASDAPQASKASESTADREHEQSVLAHRIRRRAHDLTRLRAEFRDGKLPQDEFELKGRNVIIATRLTGEGEDLGKSRDITEVCAPVYDDRTPPYARCLRARARLNAPRAQLAYSWTIRDARSRPKLREAMRAAGMMGNRSTARSP